MIRHLNHDGIEGTREALAFFQLHMLPASFMNGNRLSTTYTPVPYLIALTDWLQLSK